jgi:hypothetical protein
MTIMEEANNELFIYATGEIGALDHTNFFNNEKNSVIFKIRADLSISSTGSYKSELKTVWVYSFSKKND